MPNPSWNNHLIYIPTEGMPITIPQSHLYSRSILDNDFQFVDLKPISGFSFTIYHPCTEGQELVRNNWLSNIQRGAKYQADVYGPALALVTSVADQQLVRPEALHLQLFQDAVFQDAASRAAILALRQ